MKLTPRFGKAQVWVSPLIPLPQAVEGCGRQEQSSLRWDTVHAPTRVLFPYPISGGALMLGSCSLEGAGCKVVVVK